MKRPFFKTVILVTVVFTVLTACSNHQVKFDKEKWNAGDGISYSMRDNVLTDLVTNYKLKGMTYKDVIRLLGKPDDTAALKTSYEIINTAHEYNPKLKPTYKKSLEFYFSKDSVVTSFKVYEHTDKKGPDNAHSVAPAK
ncbi:MAG: hypothetical protein ABI308_16240 [Mucilaginibacter sp.]